MEPTRFDLNAIRVGTPCSEDWSAMTGDDRAKHCAKCEKTVYNLSELTEDEAEELILSRRVDLCVKFYRRTDGTLVTASCPTGVFGGQRRKLARATAALMAAGTMIAGAAFAGGNRAETPANNAAQQAEALREKAQAAKVCEAIPKQTVVYTVREKDTIASIAQQWDSESEWIQAANPDAQKAPLKPGQKLRVPIRASMVMGDPAPAF